MPNRLLQEYAYLFTEDLPPGPILDLASGSCRDGMFLAQKGLHVVCCDRSGDALDAARKTATKHDLEITTWQIDLEQIGADPLPQDHYAAIIVFRYLHRPLIPSLRKALKQDGIVIYETYTIDQPRYGRPHNPAYLLKPRELLSWFSDWQLIHYFEGRKDAPRRAVAQIVCRKQV